MTLDDLLTLHRKIAASMGITVDAEGKLYSEDTGTPVCINKRQYHLPTQAFMVKGGDEFLPFYLLGESISSTESEVLEKTRSLMVYKLTTMIIDLTLSLVTIGASGQAEHAKLTPRQKAVLKCVKSADQTTIETLANIYQSLQAKGQKMLVKFYQKFQGKIGDTTYSRICSVSFPILDELEAAPSQKNKVFGVACRVEDIKMFTELFYFVLGEDAAIDGHFSRGSNDLTAPYFVSLARSFIAVVKVLNEKLKRYDKETVNVDWEEELESLAAYRGLVPVGLEGTEGKTEVQQIQRPQTSKILNKLQQEAFEGGGEPKTQNQVQTVTTTRTEETKPQAYGTYSPKPYAPAAAPVVYSNSPVASYEQRPVQAPKASGNRVSYAERENEKRLRQHQQQQQYQQRVYQQPQAYQQPLHQPIVQQAAPQMQMVQIGVDHRGAPIFQQMEVAPSTHQAVYTQPNTQRQTGRLITEVDPNQFFGTGSYQQPPQQQQSHYGQTTYHTHGGQPSGPKTFF